MATSPSSASFGNPAIGGVSTGPGVSRFVRTLRSEFKSQISCKRAQSQLRSTVRAYRDYGCIHLEDDRKYPGLQRLGLSLNEIKPILKVVAEGPTKEQTMEFIADRLKVVRRKIAELREIEEYMSQNLWHR